MSIKAKELISLMNRWAPPSLAEKWDNPGLQVGSPETVSYTHLDVYKRQIIDMLYSYISLISKLVRENYNEVGKTHKRDSCSFYFVYLCFRKYNDSGRRFS